MPTSIRLLIVFLVGLGVGSLTWGVGGLMRWDAPLIQRDYITYMDVRGAIGIGAGALASAAMALSLFREPRRNGKKLDLS